MKEFIKVYLCHLCGALYENSRPFLCECRSNCFIREYAVTEEQLLALKAGQKVDGIV